MRYLSAFSGALAVGLAAALPGAPTAPSDADLGTLDPTRPEPFFACFAEGTPLDYVQSWYDQGAIPPGLMPESSFNYFLANSWNGTGAPVTLTWSLVPDGVTISGSGSPGPTEANSLFSGMNAKFGGNQALWIERIEQSFQVWEDISGIDFVRVTAAGVPWDDGASWGSGGNDVTRGDIRISMRQIDGGGGVLAFASFPTNGDIVLDRNENWQSSTNLNRFLRNVVAHELGHSLGMEHTCSSDSKILMEPFIDTSFDGPRLDDYRAVHRQHGDFYEPDNNAGAATSLGTLLPATTIAPCEVPVGQEPPSSPAPGNGRLCSIDANGENDWWRFELIGPSTITVTVDPIGKVYDNSSQSFTGACNSGNPLDTLAQADLALQVVASDGSTVLASVDATGKGSSEVIADLNLPVAGTYYVRVFETDSVPGVQIYDLFIQSSDAPDAWADLGSGLAGAAGVPQLEGTGTLASGSNNAVDLTGAAPNATAGLFLSVTSTPVPFKGGTLIAFPAIASPTILQTNGGGAISLPFVQAPGLPAGTELFVQFAVQDGGAVNGVALSNAIVGTTP